jgi:hypothetical protein
MSVKSGSGSGPDRDDIVTFSASDAALMGMIGSRLRAMYDDLLNEPVPERLLEVLQRFDQVEDKFAARKRRPAEWDVR